MITQEDLDEIKEEIDQFFEKNQPFQKYRGLDYKTELRKLAKSKELNAEQLYDSGMITRLYSRIVLLLTEKAYGQSQIERDKASPQERSTFFRYGLDYASGKRMANPPQKKEDKGVWEKFDRPLRNDKKRLYAGGNKELYDYLGGVLGDVKEQMEFIESPIKKAEYLEEIEERFIEALKKGPGTVKRFASIISDVETPRIGVVLSFQACLQLECDGRVVLGQLEGDVAVDLNQTNQH